MISLLVALLLPSLGAAKRQSHWMGCVHALRQLGLATQMYWNDHAGSMFRYRVHSAADGDRYWFGWLARGEEGSRQFDPRQGLLFPYLTTDRLGTCPSFARGHGRIKWKANRTSVSFGYNLHLSAPPNASTFKSDSILHPDATAVFADAAQVNTFQAPASEANPMVEEFYYLSDSEPTAHFRHSDRCGAAFVDGHVNAVALDLRSLDRRLPSARIAQLPSSALRIRQ